MELSCEKSCCSAGNNQVDEQAGITAQVAIVKEMTGRNRAAQLEIVKQISRQESRSSAGPDHVTDHALIM